MSKAKLIRNEDDKMIAGVCGGIAVYLGVDSIFVRLAFLILLFASGVGLLFYVILMVIMPSDSNINKSSSEIAKDNIDHFGSDLNSGVDKLRAHPQGPVIAAGLLIAIGLFLLLENLGFVGWLNGICLWPLVLIGFGLFLIFRNRR